MRWTLLLGILALVALTAGHGIGLFASPPDAAMGQTVRILYLHVPSAWTAMLAFTVAAVAAVGVLWSGRPGWDALLEGSVEVGVVFCGMLLVQGSIWARPTWSVWWTWDPRLTTTAVMMMAFLGILLLRRLVDEPGRRATASAVATIVSYVDVPVVYFSVEWWSAAHQGFSSARTVDEGMRLPLWVSLLGTVLLGATLVLWRTRIAAEARRREEDAPDLPPAPPPLDLEIAP
ncbi:MAG: cytochrome c biogenesis protein CcsA [Deltaproteobacteria bacterium]|nr:cytochrome c biogenesis protein CcsA [Deltaproteobacteria bacterium]